MEGPSIPSTQVIIYVTCLGGRPKRERISQFRQVCSLSPHSSPALADDSILTRRTKTDVVEACLASVHIPFFMDSRAFATSQVRTHPTNVPRARDLDALVTLDGTSSRNSGP